MKIFKFLVHSLILLALAALPAAAQKKSGAMPSQTAMKKTGNTVFLPNRSPLISIRLQFLTGSMDDPAGKEGVANLTAAMLAEGGSKNLTYDQIVEQFYPMATGFGSQVDKEMTTFSGTTHVDNLEKYYGLIRQMLLEPGFRDEDFTRLKKNSMSFLESSLRQGNDEELGKEQLYNRIYAGHPYGHHNVGTTASLEKLTIQDVKDFYAKNYTKTNVVLGMSGGYPATFAKTIEADFAKLPAGMTMATTGKAPARKVAAPKLDKGMKIDIVQRETRATAISIGFPTAVNRASKDYAALALVSSYFGQHRSSNSYLYGRLREVRGLNYGDYSYIEYFPRGMFQFEPDPNLARQQQIFQIWIRPVEPQNGHFALRAAMFEYDRLVKNGMTAETFEATREFLSKYVNVLTQTQGSALGYELDSRYYGIPNFNQYMKDNLAKLTLADVNAAIKKHLASDSIRVVMITKDAEALKTAIVTNAASPITYNSPKTQDVTDEDKVIVNYKINVRPEDVTITPVERVFQ